VKEANKKAEAAKTGGRRLLFGMGGRLLYTVTKKERIETLQGPVLRSAGAIPIMAETSHM
jgi:hypothetical protein